MLRLAASQARRALSQQASAACPAMARSFSAAAAEEEAVITPPVRLYGTSGRYATALYSAALRDGVLDTVATEMAQVVTELKESPDVAMYLMDPTVSKTDKAATITAALKDMKASVQTINFFGCMAENGRLGDTYKVADDFKQLVRAEKGQVKAVITTAEVLKPNQIEQVKAAVTGMLKPGQSLDMELKVDPTILGGLVVAIDDKRVDMSVATRVKRMRDAIKTAFS
eukprot:CAMPEP_0117663056 /NCGR_PEP_ID=MMETSP0804-20121206/8381_1 /TAXON_ID=1074897 /ORGANISM="Tetraselmis astigmatica, Strain CCMP880" /LENGTH=226 /DNA_ID=CAMNT_0005469993 /DNA_START=128 /DNA_END=808 /DNA_ORIENTATION=+